MFDETQPYLDRLSNHALPCATSKSAILIVRYCAGCRPWRPCLRRRDNRCIHLDLPSFSCHPLPSLEERKIWPGRGAR